MRSFLLLTVFSICLFGCKKNVVDQHYSDVETFVQQIKNGTYNNYEITSVSILVKDSQLFI